MRTPVIPSAWRPARRSGPAWAAIVLMWLAGASVAACGSTDDSTPAGPTTSIAGRLGAPATPPSTSRSTSPSTFSMSPTTTPIESTRAPTSSVAPSPSGTAADALTVADAAEITDAFVRFFGGSATTLDEKVALLEHGEDYRAMLVAASANEQFQQMTTDIRDVRSASPGECEAMGEPDDCAIVVHDLLVGGFPMAAAVASPAVRADGAWLVGAEAWCRVVEIGGASCPDPVGAAGSTP